MKSGNKITRVFAALALVLSFNLAAAEELTLRSNISIAGDVVTLGDLFEHAGAVAGKAVFRSPRLGQTGILNSRRIKLVARDNGLNWLNRKYLEKIVIRREANTITLDQISNRISEKIANNYPLRVANSQLEISLSNKAAAFIMRADGAAEFEIEKIRYDRRSGRFSAVVAGPSGSANPKRITYSGRATEVIEIPVLVQPLTRGQVFKSGFLETRKFPARRVNSQVVTEAVDLAGMAARRSLRPNSPIRISDVEKPRIVKKNTLVSVVYKLQALNITFRGRALEDGALGETISVLNSRSRRTIQTIVTAPNTVAAQSNKLRQTASLNQ